VVAFIGGLYFITHHKKEAEALQNQKVAGNGCRQNRKSAGAILKSWKAASQAYVRLPNLLRVVKNRSS
jgi:cell division protein FtsN